MENLFDPVVQQVIRLVTQQVDHISQTKGKRINVGFPPGARTGMVHID